jgi:acetyl/propionyl-CoA carboxylase alpha subunit
MIRRLLIANRGEIALRVIRACREMGIASVAVFSDADARAPHVLAADHAVRIGPPPARESYLSIQKVVDAALSSKADGVHPGYGFLSENPAFAKRCEAAGLVFVGPPAAAIERMGSKIEARKLAVEAGVPVVPGETPSNQSDAGVLEAMERVGYPVLVKASAGGGGKGMRTVASPNGAAAAAQAARREALAAFGDGTLYVERLIDRPHHVEVQVFADARGRTIHLFERECSVQRRHQKVIEESPSPIVDKALRDRMTHAAVGVARTAGYRNAGTVEFLVDGAQFYFLEMNTRLQVEHPVTEGVTGLDLVRAQILLASGEPLPWPDADVFQRGHSIEARVYAEDPSQGFLPQAGRLTEYRAPHLPGLRIDSGVVEGGEVSVYYDPMIAKVIATAESRDLAINRLVAGLRAFHVRGIRTNIAFLLRVLDSDAFRRGAVDTGFLDRDGARLMEPADGAEGDVEAPRAEPAANGGRPGAAFDPWNGVAARATSPRPVATPRRRRAGTDGHQVLTAPMPATVLKIGVNAGDAVRKGDVIVLLEAMKMELPVRAMADGVVAAVHCREGELVQADAPLVEMQ